MTINGGATDQAIVAWQRIMALFNATQIDRHRRLARLLYRIPTIKRFGSDSYWLVSKSSQIKGFRKTEGE